MRNWIQIFALLMPGLGLILVLIGSVVYIAIAQSFGYYALLGESAFSTEFWSEVFSRKIFGNISIASSDSAADAMTETAIEQANRAINELSL